MKLSNDELIKEFLEKKQGEYPDLEFQDMKEICHGPWKMLHETMESGELDTVRLKYFGVFQVRVNRAKAVLKNMKERFKVQKIAPTEYFKYKEQLEVFIDKHEKNDEENEKAEASK